MTIPHITMINGWRAGNAYDPNLISTPCVHVLNDHSVSGKDVEICPKQKQQQKKKARQGRPSSFLRASCREPGKNANNAKAQQAAPGTLHSTYSRILVNHMLQRRHWNSSCNCLWAQSPQLTNAGSRPHSELFLHQLTKPTRGGHQNNPAMGLRTCFPPGKASMVMALGPNAALQ